MTSELIDRIKALQGRLRRGAAVNVNDREAKSEVIGAATAYFESFRPTLVGTLGETDAIKAHDEEWQELVRLAHGNNQRRTYLKALATILRGVTELSVASLSSAAGKSTGRGGLSTLTPAERQILTTLDALLPTAAASYRQGISDLREAGRLSYRGTASEFREALREALDHLAPDEDVAKVPGFKYEEGLKRPTMKQKVRYVMTSRGRPSSQRDVTERSVRGVEDLTGAVLRATYDRASLATHLETTRTEVLRIKRYVDTVFFDLLEIVEADADRPTSP
jgi:hypothetical protein